MNRAVALLPVVLCLGLGPAALPLAAQESWAPAGPPGGLPQRLVIHPGNPKILWAGTWNAGVFKSTDGGTTWTRTVQGLANWNVRALAVAPSDPDTLYAAALPPSGAQTSVFRSTDGGMSWTAVLSCPPHPISGTGCARLVQTLDLDVDPHHPGIVYASTLRGVFKSVNGGVRWNPTGRITVAEATYALAIDPGEPRILYAGGDRGVARSTDGGATWAPWNDGMGSVAVREIVIDPANPRRIWAGASISQGVYRSTDGGAHWRRTRAGLPSGVDVLALSAVAGRDLPAVWAGTGARVFRSLDGGNAWNEVLGLRNQWIEALVADPARPGTVWAASPASLRTDRVPGIYKSADGGATWRLAGRGLFGQPTGSLAFDPATPGVLWACSPRSGVFRSADRGATWTLRNGDFPVFGALEINAVEVDPRDPETVWAATSLGAYVTEDGGATWEARGEGLSFPVYRLRFAPANPSVVYAMAASTIARSDDGGGHWTHLDVPYSFLFPGVTDLLVDPRAPLAVFVASGEIYASRDGGATWDYLPVAAEATEIAALAGDPRNPDVLYAGGAEGLFRSADGGGTWQRLTAFPASGVTQLAVGPTGQVWAGAADGVWVSPDGAAFWALAPGMEGFSVQEIEVDPGHPGTAFAATGLGLFRHGD